MKIIVLDDGNRGNLNQALGIAERLPGTEIEKITVPPLSFFRRACLLLAANLADIIPLFKIRFLLRHFARIIPLSRFPKPAAIISTGSKLAPINVLLSRCSLAVSVQILRPDFVRLRLFDLLVMPEHDLWRYPKVSALKNLVAIKGATNRILSSQPQPYFPSEEGEAKKMVRIAILIGGDDKNYRISEAWAKQLSGYLLEISAKLPAEIYLTTSRRTAVGVEEVFRQTLGDNPDKFKLVLYWQTFANPVTEFLAAADLVLTTEDSINMVSESASSGKPTVVLRVERKHQKRLVFDRALENLADNDYVRLWSLQNLTLSNIIQAIRDPDRPVLAETEKVGRSLMELLKTKEVLIVGVSCLGDNLIFSPAYRTVRENFPLAKIDVITDLRSAGYFENHPYFRKIFYYNKRDSWYEKERFLKEIQGKKYDYVFNFRSSVFGLANKAKKRANFYLPALLGVRKGEHETDRWLRLLAYFLPLSPDRSFYFPLAKEDFTWAEETIARLKLKSRNFVVLNPEGRWDKKRWPPESFAKLAELIWRNYHLPSVVVGDKNEKEIAACLMDSLPFGKTGVSANHAAAGEQIINLTGKTTVRQLTALLSKTALLVSNDTGTVHLASAVHCPVAVLFGPGDWRRYGPYQTKYRIISSGLTCSPCLKVTCPRNFVCWHFVTLDKVLKDIAPFLI